jgi:hypothetical protein
MRVVPAAAILALVVVALTGCGSSQPSGVAGANTIQLHQTTRHYSVQQVRAAFGAEGIGLRKAVPPPGQVAHDVVFLGYGSRPHFVRVAISTEKSFRPIGSCRNKPGFCIAFIGHPRVRRTRRGNVLAYYDPGHSAAVKAALARLH